MTDTKIDKRSLHRLAEELKRKPPKITEYHKAEGNRLLKEAIQDKEQKRLTNRKDIANFSWETAKDLINAGKNRILSYGGFGQGNKLGAGRWRYENGEWVKRD